MQIDGVWCRCGTSVTKKYDLDHYMKAQCERPPMPFGRARGIVKNLLDDKNHSDLRITITRAMSCPLQVVLEDDFGPHTIDVLDFDAAFDGTKLHHQLAEDAPPGWYTEVTFPKKGCAGLFGDVDFGGTPDLIRSDFSAIEEAKTSHLFSQIYKHKAVSSGERMVELECQVNMQRLLIAQHTGADIQVMIGWHYARVPADGPPAWIRVRLGRMTEDEIARTRCFDSVYTVQQNVDFIRRYREHRQAGVPKAVAARRIPKAGVTQFKGKKCLYYCPVKDLCDKVQAG